MEYQGEVNIVVCRYCETMQKESITDFSIEMDDGNVLTILDVPVLVCEVCGEKFYTLEVSMGMDKIIAEYRERKCDSPSTYEYSKYQEITPESLEA